MQWEYLVRVRHRDKGFLKISKWKDDVEKELPKLGADGWELVSVSPQAGIIGSSGTTYC